MGYETARALEIDEIASILDDYRKCAVQAKCAGFDWNLWCQRIQFLQSSTNPRPDKYGGSIENRYRILKEIVKAVKTAYPADRICVPLAPLGNFGGMCSPYNSVMFTYAIKRLSEHKLGYQAMLDDFGSWLQGQEPFANGIDTKTALRVSSWPTTSRETQPRA